MMDVSAQIFLEQAPASKGNGPNPSNTSNDNAGKDKFSSVLQGERSSQQANEHAPKSDEMKKDKVETSSRRDGKAQKNSGVSEAPAEQEAKPEKIAEKAKGRGPEQAAEKMEEKVSEEKPMPEQANAEQGQQQAADRHALLAMLLKQSGAAESTDTDDELKLDADVEVTTDTTLELTPEPSETEVTTLQLPDAQELDADKVLDELEGAVTQQASEAVKETKPQETPIVKEDPKPEKKVDPAAMSAEQTPELVNPVVQGKSEQGEQKDDEAVKIVEDNAKRPMTKAELLQQQAKQSNEENKDEKSESGSLEELEANADADKLAEETLQQLERHNMKFEAILAAKNAHMKQASAADSIDLLSDKLAMQNGIERASMTSSSTAQANGVGLRGQQTPGMPSYVMDTPVESDEWGAVFSKRISFLAKNGVQHAEIRLDPPEMGRVNVKIKISNDHATIHFTAQHGNVRDAIETSMPRLREMLQESGLGLGNVDVSTQQFAQRQQEQFAQGHEGHFGRASFGADADSMDESAELMAGAGRVISSDSLVDYFA